MSSSFQSEVVSHAFSNSISMASCDTSDSFDVPVTPATPDAPLAELMASLSTSMASEGVGGAEAWTVDLGNEFGRKVASGGFLLSLLSILWTHLLSRRSLCYKISTFLAINSQGYSWVERSGNLTNPLAILFDTFDHLVSRCVPMRDFDSGCMLLER